MSALGQVCILAGGRGTRLGPLGADRPKALVPVAGKPFLYHQLALLARHGASEVLLCVGHLGEQIEAAIGDALFGLEIAYSYDSAGLDGTLGALRRAAHLLDERFLVLYGDTYLQIDYADVAQRWADSGCRGLMTVYENHGRLGRSNARYGSGRVLSYDKFAPSPDMTYIDYGLGGLYLDSLQMLDEAATDLAALYHELARRGELFGYVATERFYEVGSPDALAETAQMLGQASIEDRAGEGGDH